VFVVLVIQHPNRMRRIIMPSVARLALPNFSTLSYTRHDFLEKNKVVHKMCNLTSSKNLSETCHFEKKLARYDQKFIVVFKYKIRYSCQILMKLEFYRQIFEKYTNIKLYENPFSWSWGVPFGRADRHTNKHDEAKSRYSQFCERA